MSDVAAEALVEEGLPVRLASGAVFKVLSQEEADYVEERRERYLDDNQFPNISDQQDIDRLLVLEILCFRWGIWLSLGKDYWGDSDFDDVKLRDSLNKISQELRLIKKSLGIDKLTRDKNRGEESVTRYLQQLGERARAFGIMRNHQAAKAIELFMRLDSLVVLYDNCDEVERTEMHLSPEAILDWIRDQARPEFQAIDKIFRENEQRYWVAAQ